MVVDSPPGTGDEPMSVVQLAGKPCGAVIVTTPQDIAINDVRRCITFCRKMDVPVLGIVENMSGFHCPKCGEMTFLFKSGGGQALATEMDVPFLGCIPIEPQIVLSGDDGVPFINKNIENPASKEFAKIVQQLILTIQDMTINKTGETK